MTYLFLVEILGKDNSKSMELRHVNRVMCLCELFVYMCDFFSPCSRFTIKTNSDQLFNCSELKKSLKKDREMSISNISGIRGVW